MYRTLHQKRVAFPCPQCSGEWEGTVDLRVEEEPADRHYPGSVEITAEGIRSEELNGCDCGHLDEDDEVLDEVQSMIWSGRVEVGW